MFDRIAYMKEYHRKHYALHRLKYIESAKARQREKAEEIAEYKKKWSMRPDVVAKHKEDTEKQRTRWPHKYIARYTVSNAIARGDIVPGVCKVCGDPNTHGHHRDYAKPLDVVWLCAKHHREEHKRVSVGESPAGRDVPTQEN